MHNKLQLLYLLQVSGEETGRQQILNEW